MPFKYQILNLPEHREIYYLHILKHIRSGWFQKNGFNITPQRELDDSSEIVFPKTNILTNQEIYKFLDSQPKDYQFPFSLINRIHEYKAVKPFDETLFPEKLNTKKVEEFFNKNKDKLQETIDFLIPNTSKQIIFNIIPTDFGSRGTFSFEETEDKIDFYTTYIVTTSTYFLVATLVFAVSVHNLGATMDAQEDPIFWAKRQFLVDFLVRKTKISEMAHTTDIQKYELIGATRLDQLGDVARRSHEYLKQLGFDFSADIAIKDDLLLINNAQIYLTTSEQTVMQHLIGNRDKIVSFDSLGNVLWGENSEKFSLYAISRILSNIRKKIRNAGFINELIYTARGRGVLLRV